MSDDLDRIRGDAFAAIEYRAETYSPGRYPYTYSADFLRAHPDLVPAHLRVEAPIDSRANASWATGLWAKEAGVSKRSLCETFADCYLLEHGIPLSAAGPERSEP